MSYIEMKDKSGKKSWFRRIGIYGFDFVNDSTFASELTPEECEEVMKHSEWYLKIYGAESLDVVEKIRMTVKQLKGILNLFDDSLEIAIVIDDQAHSVESVDVEPTDSECVLAIRPN